MWPCRREGFVLDSGLKDCWSRFTDKSDEKFFRKFVKGFVGQWEGKVCSRIVSFTHLFTHSFTHSLKVCPNWEMMVTARLEGERDEGPRLAELPEELLPALSKYLFVGEDEAEEVRLIEGDSVPKHCTFMMLLLICRQGTRHVY